MMIQRIVPLGIFFTLLLFPSFAASETAKDGQETLVVGTKVVAPFVMKTKTGEWTGISIDLWKEIASALGLSYEFKELDLQGILAGVADGSLDAAVAALTVTSEREELFDFTHPFYTSGLGIAVSGQKGSPWWSVLRKFLSLAFFKVVTTLALVLLGVGALVWWFERKRNPAQFGRGTARGVGSGFWWSAVTMTTVGYGDKAPVTPAGRLVALIWMFVSIIVISTFTAAITSSLTVSKLGTAVQGPQDLVNVRVGSIPNTTSAAYLVEARISFQQFSSAEEGLEALGRGKVDAFVYDAPVLRYLVNKDYPGILTVLSQTFEKQNYGFALPHGSPLRESVNRVLLKKVRGSAWQDLLYRYLGR